MNFFFKKRRVVIKIGSSLLVSDNSLRQVWLCSLVRNIVDLRSKGIQVVVVSSGAIALGRAQLNLLNSALSLEEKQASAAIGQIALMSTYSRLFGEVGVKVAQILLTAADCNSRKRYLNCTNTINTLLSKQVVPVINENDSVAIDEIKIGDNDRLAARVSQMIGADLMILLSDIDGLYDKNPRLHSDANFIGEVTKIDRGIEKMAGGSSSKLGTGGMITKILSAKMLENSGCDVVITNGTADDAIGNLFNLKQKFTIFCGGKTANNSKKRWLRGLINSDGKLFINECASKAIKSGIASLLPIGVTKIEGKFLKGGVLFIYDDEGRHIANGISNYSSSDIASIMQQHSDLIEKILGKNSKTEIIHIDNLVVIN